MLPFANKKITQLSFFALYFFAKRQTLNLVETPYSYTLTINPAAVSSTDGTIVFKSRGIISAGAPTCTDSLTYGLLYVLHGECEEFDLITQYRLHYRYISPRPVTDLAALFVFLGVT